YLQSGVTVHASSVGRIGSFLLASELCFLDEESSSRTFRAGEISLASTPFCEDEHTDGLDLDKWFDLCRLAPLLPAGRSAGRKKAVWVMQRLVGTPPFLCPCLCEVTLWQVRHPVQAESGSTFS